MHTHKCCPIINVIIVNIIIRKKLRGKTTLFCLQELVILFAFFVVILVRGIFRMVN